MGLWLVLWLCLWRWCPGLDAVIVALWGAVAEAAALPLRLRRCGAVSGLAVDLTKHPEK